MNTRAIATVVLIVLAVLIAYFYAWPKVRGIPPSTTSTEQTTGTQGPPM